MTAKPNLISTADVLKWASCVSKVPRRYRISDVPYVAGVPVGPDTETAAYIAECVCLYEQANSVRFMPEGREGPIGAAYQRLAENERLRRAFDAGYNSAQFPERGPKALRAYYNLLCDAINNTKAGK